MEVIAAVGSWALASTCNTVPATSWLSALCPQQYRHDISLLNARLSAGAKIHLPGAEGFARATWRWSAGYAPEANIVVVPSTGDDVAETVKYANEKHVPFLAISGNHGTITSMAKMRGGIEIWLEQLNSVDIAPDGKTARFGGGILNKEAKEALWAAGKQAVTGSCECVSLLGPGLGGGHGFLQGRYGLVSDQFVAMDVVLADGSLRTIDAGSDLWWAMQGAGHNFGIVTSVTSKIYDIEHRDWAATSFIFDGSKVEQLYDAINEHLLKNGTRPVDVLDFSVFINNPEVDPDKVRTYGVCVVRMCRANKSQPMVLFFVMQEGASEVDPSYTAPFTALKPLISGTNQGTYLDIPSWIGISTDGPTCQKSEQVKMHFPLDLQVYSPAGQRQVYDLFASATRKTPALNASSLLFEGYSVQGVRAVSSESTAYPFRANNLIVSPEIKYAPAGPEMDREAIQLGTRLREILHQASGRKEMDTYVNYAAGVETVQQMYGHEPWRLKKLRDLKRKYDPHGRFNFYAPIVA
ncbi:FAD binding domain protein [Purpureocillium lilacinum]|uniref:FAD binding domain protein n=1 Tax=Purpureocillium lilacinum TaxID=33203 RepID=A0A2U3ED76_PURLI|nr:FAD binding domain protein [Purpureocillium lilacinum]